MALALAVLMMAVAGGAVGLVGWFGVTGRLPRNRWAGIRVPYTMSSDERWAAAHRAGGPLMLFGGVAVAASGLAFGPFALADAVPGAVLGGLLAVQAVVLLASAVLSAVVGVRGARETVG